MPVVPFDGLSGSASPLPPQPWPTRTVGAFAPAERPAAGKKWVVIGVPSKEVTVASRAVAGDAHTPMAIVAWLAAANRLPFVV